MNEYERGILVSMSYDRELPPIEFPIVLFTCTSVTSVTLMVFIHVHPTSGSFAPSLERHHVAFRPRRRHPSALRAASEVGPSILRLAELGFVSPEESRAALEW